MKLDITTLPVLYINLKKDKERNQSTKTILKELGFKKIKRIDAVNKEKIKDLRCPYGCANCQYYKTVAISRSHIKALKYASRFNGPFLIVEDDIQLSEDFQTVFEIPQNADAFYACTSEGAIRSFSPDYVNREWMPPEFSPEISNGIHGLYNMTSATAIVYLSDRFKKVVQAACEESFIFGVPHDVLLTRSLKNFNVYISNVPVFWQKGLFFMTGNKLTDYATERQRDS